MIKVIALILLTTNVAWSFPGSLEVWFISNSKVAQLHKLLNEPHYIFRKTTAELQCQQVGDYCFDPQYGLYKKEEMKPEEVQDVDTAKVEDDKPQIKSTGSVDRELINCDPNNYFDIFCGKARKDVPRVTPKLDLWVDTSSSMREFDFSAKDGSCHRKSLVNVLDKACGFNRNVNVMMFDTSIKQAGTPDSLCTNSGLNDYKRLIDWIERSDAKKLVIITDIYEFHKEFSDYVESKHGHFRGDKDALTAAQMEDLASDLANLCR